MRQQAVHRVLPDLVATARAFVIGRLIDQLRSRRTTDRVKAASSLLALGACAVPCLTSGMLNSKNEYVQIGTAVVLGRLMPTLPDMDQCRVCRDLMIKQSMAKSPRVALAIAEVLASVQP